MTANEHRRREFDAQHQTARADEGIARGCGKVQFGGPRAAALLVIDSDPGHIERARQRGFETLEGNAADPEIIQAANLPAACCLLVAIPDAFEGGQVVEQGRKLNPALTIVARAHSEAEIEHLKKHGATTVVMSEHQIAKAMIAGIPT